MTKPIVGLVITLVISVVYGVAFKVIYPLVNIDSGLAFFFALSGLVTYLSARAILHQLKRTPK